MHSGRGKSLKTKMRCIVTAGPTYEELDEVRRLTNFSTGTLGTELTQYLTEQGHEVVLLRGYYATCRLETRANTAQVFTTVADLRERLRQLGAQGADAVFHAAAVSDFTFGKIWNRAADGSLQEVQAAKISSRVGLLLAELRPAPKILAELRGWFPKAYLTGWKYELEGDREQAAARARGQVEENQTDACVVNGRAYGNGFGLISPTGTCEHLPDKPALFATLLEKVLAKVQKT
jgi:phosphopantothenoylcysteine decarboxylase/phosphopantothenate--cysteine ligase